MAAGLIFGGSMLAAPSRAELGLSTLDELVERMRTNHPALRATRARSEAAQRQVEAVRIFADPTAKLGGGAATSRGTRASESGDLIYGFEQRLPILGKETAARRLAEAEAAAAQEKEAAIFEALRRDLIHAAVDAALKERLVDLAKEELEWHAAQISVAAARYESGKGSQLDLLRFRSEHAARSAALQSEEQRRDSARAALLRAMGITQDPALPSWTPTEPPPLKLDPDALAATATRRAPQIRLLSKEVRLADSTVDATRKSRRPDIAVGVEGRQFHDDAGFREGTGYLSLNLPWFNREKYRKDLARDQARSIAAREDLLDEQVGVRTDVVRLARELESARRETTAYGSEVLPLAEQTFKAAEIAWASGLGMLTDLMESRRAYIQAEILMAKSGAMEWDRLDDIAFTCGLTLEALLQGKLPSAGSADDPTPPRHP